MSAKNTKTLQRRDSFIGTPYWWVKNDDFYTLCILHITGKERGSELKKKKAKNDGCSFNPSHTQPDTSDHTLSRSLQQTLQLDPLALMPLEALQCTLYHSRIPHVNVVNHYLEEVQHPAGRPAGQLLQALKNMAVPVTQCGAVPKRTDTFHWNAWIDKVNKVYLNQQTGREHDFPCVWGALCSQRCCASCQQTQADCRSVLDVDTCKIMSLYQYHRLLWGQCYVYYKRI